MEDLWLRDSYITERPAIFNRSIIEYDMKSAGLSIAKEFQLLPPETIQKLERMGKQERVVSMGNLKRDNKEYSKQEKNGFALARKLFFEQNEIAEPDVVAIKRDAIFLQSYVQLEQVGTFLNFRKKHEYTSFVKLSPIEIYYKNGKLDVKGIHTDTYQEVHADYFGTILAGIIADAETLERPIAIRNAVKVFDRYKRLELPMDCYREFNAQSKFRYLDGQLSGSEYRADLSQLDITCNLEHLVSIIYTLLRE